MSSKVMASVGQKKAQALGVLRHDYSAQMGELRGWRQGVLGQLKAWYSDQRGKVKAWRDGELQKLKAQFTNAKAQARAVLDSQKRQASLLGPPQGYEVLMNAYPQYYLNLGSLVLDYRQGVFNVKEQAARMLWAAKKQYEQKKAEIRLAYIEATERLKAEFRAKKEQVMREYYRYYYELKAWYYRNYYRLKIDIWLQEHG